MTRKNMQRMLILVLTILFFSFNTTAALATETTAAAEATTEAEAVATTEAAEPAETAAENAGPVAVLADGWDAASLEELRDAQQQLSQRIAELRKADYEAGEAIVITGTDADIQTGIEVDFLPARVTFESEGSGKVDLTGGEYDFSVIADEGIMTKLLAEKGTYTALVEATGAWTLTIEPIAPGASLPLTGTGPFVSDLLELTEPQVLIVEAKVTGTEDVYSTFYLDVSYVSEYDPESWSTDYIVMESLESGSELKQTAILQTEAHTTDYILAIDCYPGVEWSITVKP